ncbi:MAG: asparagine synthase (glutamine-hydrolyzing) [Betaproteobacteria bacterium]|nr:asparagine synthase (glutamine-hydrolyzing) [Betaproteobacteria bacterium]
MCGLAGYLGPFAPRLLERMSASIAHRGPDGQGNWFSAADGAGLAHRRLSIIDLSESGAQPMSDPATGVVISYNGEIYNYRELRDELLADHGPFRGHSDTEVLLYLYLKLGASMLEKLNGIFALAIWDPRSTEMLLARDGLGVKPLYYAQTPKGVVFASELKALLEEPSVPRGIDAAAVARHLLYLWSTGPSTMLASVKKLEPGHALALRDGRIARSWRFYELPTGNAPQATEENAAIDEVRRGVERSVERQMIADVPVGAFLSGGLDSSAVVAMARRHTRERLQCFSIEVQGEGAAVEGMTEDLPYARRVAAHLGVDLHTVPVGPEMADHLREMIYHLDEPTADPAPLNAYFICRLARERGMKVLLSGTGGDDVFTGYRRHYALTQERRWRWLPLGTRAALRGAASALPVGSPAMRRLRKAFEYADVEGPARIASYFWWLDPARVIRLLAPELRRAVTREALAEPLVSSLRELPVQASALDRMLFLEQRYFLADHNLNYMDKMSMAHGVEVRVPLIDRDLVDLAARLPDNLKQRGRTGKWIFKKAMEGELPRDVIYRPKTGFGVPLRHWLRNQLRPLVEDMLSRNALARRGLFDADAVQSLVRSDREGRVDAAYTIFAILCMELWCRTFVDGSAV